MTLDRLAPLARSAPAPSTSILSRFPSLTGR